MQKVVEHLPTQTTNLDHLIDQTRQQLLKVYQTQVQRREGIWIEDKILFDQALRELQYLQHLTSPNPCLDSVTDALDPKRVAIWKERKEQHYINEMQSS